MQFISLQSFINFSDEAKAGSNEVLINRHHFFSIEVIIVIYPVIKI